MSGKTKNILFESAYSRAKLKIHQKQIFVKKTHFLHFFNKKTKISAMPGKSNTFKCFLKMLHLRAKMKNPFFA